MTSTLRERALRLLARCEQTRAGMARKLARHGTPEDIETLLSELERSGLLSDARYAEAFVASRVARHGAARLRRDLKLKGVGDALINAHVTLDPQAELVQARAMWLKKFGTAPQDAKEYARQVRYLLARGFASDTVRKILKDTDCIES